ncbi:MAG: hypothetical protein U0800_12030 [Isosphaeraceae bacterium]
MYNQVQAPAANAADAQDDDDLADDPRRTEGSDIVDRNDPDRAVNPLPWKTIVRFKIDDPHTRRTGFGSGTVIDSNDQESLHPDVQPTCSRIEGGLNRPSPLKFPLPSRSSCSTGNGRGPNMKVLKIQETPGKVGLDYNSPPTSRS